MKRVINQWWLVVSAVVLWMFGAATAGAQVIVGNYSITYVSVAPTGACFQNAPLRFVVPSGVLYGCQNGTWAIISSGGGGSGTVSGQASGVIPLGTSATVIGGQSHCNDGVSTASTVTCTESLTSTGIVTGSTAVTSPSLPISVKSKGAKCDGSTDDTTAFQNALNTSGNIRVSVPYSANSCIISDVLLLHSNTWLDVDPNTTIYEASGNNVMMLRNTDIPANVSNGFSDNFVRGAGGLGGNWGGSANIQIISNSNIANTAGSANAGYAWYTAHVYSSTQCSWISDVNVPSTLQTIGVAVRVTDAGNMYLLNVQTNGTFQIYAAVASSFTLLGTITSGTLVGNEQLMICVSGSSPATVTVYRDGALMNGGTFSDSHAVPTPGFAGLAISTNGGTSVGRISGWGSTDGTQSVSLPDSNIKVTGGIWDNNWVGNPGLDPYSTGQFFLQSAKVSPTRGFGGTLGFVGVSNLEVGNMTINNPNHFGIQVSQSNDFYVHDIMFLRSQATISDGVHVNGPSNRFTIEKINGATGDDFVALNAWDWTDSTPNAIEGDIINGTVSVLRPNAAVWAACSKLATGVGAGVYNVTFNDCKGTSSYGGFIVGSFGDGLVPAHLSGVGTVGGIKIGNCALATTSTTTASNLNLGNDTYGSAVYLAGNVLDLTIDSCRIDATYQQASQPWLVSKKLTNAQHIAVTNFNTNIDPPFSKLFDFSGTANSFTLSDSDFHGVAGTFGGNSTWQLVYAEATGTLNYAGISNVRTYLWDGLLGTAAGAGATNATVSNTMLNSDKDVFACASTCAISLSNNSFLSISSSVVNAFNAASAYTVSSSGNSPSGAAASVGSGATVVKSLGSVRWSGYDLPINATLLTPLAGDQIYNTQAPIGPDVYTGAAWVRPY